MLQLNTDWTSSHIDWLSGATAGSLLVLHLELYSCQFAVADPGKEDGEGQWANVRAPPKIYS